MPTRPTVLAPLGSLAGMVSPACEDAIRTLLATLDQLVAEGDALHAAMLAEDLVNLGSHALLPRREAIWVLNENGLPWSTIAELLRTDAERLRRYFLKDDSARYYRLQELRRKTLSKIK